jgi:putative flippase GtrA
MGEKISKRTIKELFSFYCIGIVNTALTYGIYAGLVYLGIYHQLALIADYAFGIVFSYFFNKHITFGIVSRTNFFMMFRMVISYVPILFINMALLWVLVDKNKANKYVSQIVSLVVCAILSFVVQKLFVFNIHSRDKHGV